MPDHEHADTPRRNGAAPLPPGMPHDVLAAEEFAMPVPAHEASGYAETRGAAHDVLAAEEFAFPATRPRAPVDPTSEPHDVLAAEEFAIPAAGAAAGADASRRTRASYSALVSLAVAGLVVLALGARRRQGLR